MAAAGSMTGMVKSPGDGYFEEDHQVVDLDELNVGTR